MNKIINCIKFSRQVATLCSMKLILQFFFFFHPSDSDEVDEETVETLIIPGCNGDAGSYGCCSDGITAATGPNQEGCPGNF